MLPILPALLLLLMHGPSNLERLARDGRLPAKLEAIRQEMAQVAPYVQTADDTALAAILSTHDLRLAQALIGLLQPEPPKKPLKPAEPRPVVIRSNPQIPPLVDGFAECRRSRDGPFAIA